jgi:protein involved in polysaccharide export with SLBB domain
MDRLIFASGIDATPMIYIIGPQSLRPLRRIILFSSMTTPNLSRRFFGFLAIGILGCTQVHAQNAPADRSARSVKFRQSSLDVAPQSAVVVPAPGSQPAESEAEDLAEKKQTLENEARYARAKLEAAQNRLAAATAAGSLEQADKLEQEVKTWEGRLKEARAQLAQVNQELAPAVAVTGNRELIVPGETLEVYVVEDPSFNGRYQVRRGGYIILPQVGRIAVAGKGIDGAESSVRRALQASQLQKASVMIEPIEGSDAEAGPTIYLSGEFQHPHPYKIPPGTAATLVSVILSSGGVTDKADLSKVKVMRMAANKGVVEEINVQAILDGKGLGSDVTLSEGDVVIIPVGQPNLVYVTGNVKRQGSYKLVPGEKLTAYGAILQSGGFARFADKKAVHVLRAMPDGTKVKIPVDVVAVSKGFRPDVQLQVDDIVVVPEKFFSF